MTQTSTGKWLLRWWDPPDPITGERHRRNLTVPGPKRAAAAQLATLTARTQIDTTTITLDHTITAWRASAGHELGTTRNYNLAYRTLTTHLLNTPIARIRTATLTTLYTRVQAAHGVPRTRTVHALISGALTYAWRQEWITDNPARRVRPPAQPRRQHTEPDRTELDRLLEVTATDPQLNAWLIVSATTGARRGEVLALRWSHINLDRAQILITQALDPIDGHEKGTKTGSTRMIAVGPATIAALRTWRTALRQRALATVGHLIDDPFVFTDTLDGSHPWRPDVATKRFGRIRNTAGTPTVRLHDLRHYVATTLLAAGIEPKTVAARLGHTRVATTSDLYAHAIPARDRAAANILDTGTV